MKHSIKISLCLLGLMLASSQVAFASQFAEGEELIRKPVSNNHSSNGCGGLHSPQLLAPSSEVKTSITFNKDDYKECDPYDLEELHQKYFREKNFPEAAKALIASAMRGEMENQDYLLRINPQALIYIEQGNTGQIQILLSKVSEALALQFIHYQKPAQSVTLNAYKAYPGVDTSEIITKKVGAQ